jgi:DNA-binding CsgD family transcriptional regulator
MSGQMALALPPSKRSEAIIINGRCTLRIEGEKRVVVVAGLVVHSYNVEDSIAEAYAMVLLVEAGYAQQNEVARAFGCSERTVRRHQRRYARGGMVELSRREGWRTGRRRIASKRLRTIERLKADGLSNREIGRRMGVTEKAIRKLIGPSQEPEQQVLFQKESCETQDDGSVEQNAGGQLPSVTSKDRNTKERKVDPENDYPETIPMSLDRDPSDRSFDRLMACFGLLDDAAPLFRPGSDVAGAGVLFAVPFLVQSGIFLVSRKLYGEIGPAFYGLRTTLMALLLMALLRIKRPEHIKERDPATLGRLLGLDRAPEVKTVRRKLTRLAAYHRAEQLGAELARIRVEQRGRLMGFLYIDGHVRAYHGKHQLPKTYVATRHLAMPATTDYWVNDRSGDPLFVVTAEANASMTKMLPELLVEVRKLVGKRRVTIVFDRGGWSPKLFQKIVAAGFDILTYRKGKTRRISEKRFVEYKATVDGRRLRYRLFDQPVRFLKGKLRLRQVTRLCDDGHQTQVITSRFDMRAVEVAYRMFERWRQENFFKYMNEEFLIDALADYQVEPDDPTRTVPNPHRKTLDKQIKAARAELAKLEQKYGEAAIDNPENNRPTMRGFKIAYGKLGKQIRDAKKKLDTLIARRKALPKRIEVRDLGEAAVIKLATERKHLTNIIKMVAYQAESDLLTMLRPHYARAEQEGRTLLHDLFAAFGDISVAHDELRITLAPLSSPHRTEAVLSLCELLNQTETRFPGTGLRLHFAVRPPPRIGLAFPGPGYPRGQNRASGNRKPDISRKG